MSENNDEQTVEAERKRGEVRAAAERVLSAALGGGVRLRQTDVLRERYRNGVVRLAVEEAPPGVPESVIVKFVDGHGNRRYDPADDSHESTAWRLRNEWAGNRFLNDVGGEPPLSARFYGGDHTAGCIVLEDLGADGECLADRLQGDDPARAEAGLVAYAASLGRMHARTAGRADAYARLRRSLGGREAGDGCLTDGGREFVEGVGRLRATCGKLGVPVADGFDDEMESVRETLNAPGPFLTFAPGDTCPDNHRILADGSLRFFDFEFAGFRHALLDAAYLYLPFPTCWCVRRVPPALLPRLEAAYRDELARGVPEAADDAVFFPALVRACAYWAVTTLVAAWAAGLESALEKDDRWGLATVRQRHPLRLENVAGLAERHGELPAFARTARALSARLRALWPDTDEMPLYTPFENPEE
jgi:hypothetical protein